jgi:hypothetical protein
MPRHPVPSRAKPPTPEEAEQRREDMTALNEGIQQTIAEGRRALWKLAEQLSLWHDDIGWSALGYDSLEEWLEDPTIEISRGRFRDLVDTYRFLEQREVPKQVMARLNYTKVRTVLPAVRAHRVDLADALKDAQALGSRALREKYSVPSTAKRTEEAGRPAYDEPSDPAADETPAPASAPEPVEPADIEPRALSTPAQPESTVADAAEPPTAVEGTATEVDPQKSALAEPTTSGRLSGAATDDDLMRPSARLYVGEDQSGGWVILGLRDEIEASPNRRADLVRRLSEGRPVHQLRVMGPARLERLRNPTEATAAGQDRA